ncbi:hypothetical protein, partial [Actinomadura darangshiensis]|uniref:hypothetical protein n=1 Tax=Actinomadura darangshiensis TaxID=705336 RepID=UPI001A9F684D
GRGPRWTGTVRAEISFRALVLVGQPWDEGEGCPRVHRGGRPGVNGSIRHWIFNCVNGVVEITETGP